MGTKQRSNAWRSLRRKRSRMVRRRAGAQVSCENRSKASDGALDDLARVRRAPANDESHCYQRGERCWSRSCRGAVVECAEDPKGGYEERDNATGNRGWPITKDDS